MQVEVRALKSRTRWDSVSFLLSAEGLWPLAPEGSGPLDSAVPLPGQLVLLPS